MQTTKRLSGIIPANVISLDWYHDKPVLTWYTPAQQVEAFYSEGLHIPNGKIHVPAMVWKWNEERSALTVYAMLKDDKPTEKTALYNAPFHNVYDRNSYNGEGYVCLGSAGQKHIKKADTFTGIIATVMRVFWRTEFSAIHNTNAVTGNLNTLHIELVNTGCKFPMDRLVKANKTLKDIL